MPFYQYRKSHFGKKTILRPSYLHNGISYAGKTTSLYWIGAQLLCSDVNLWWSVFLLIINNSLHGVVCCHLIFPKKARNIKQTMEVYNCWMTADIAESVEIFLLIQCLWSQSKYIHEYHRYNRKHTSTHPAIRNEFMHLLHRMKGTMSICIYFINSWNHDKTDRHFRNDISKYM